MWEKELEDARENQISLKEMKEYPWVSAVYPEINLVPWILEY